MQLSHEVQEVMVKPTNHPCYLVTNCLGAGLVLNSRLNLQILKVQILYLYWIAQVWQVHHCNCYCYTGANNEYCQSNHQPIEANQETTVAKINDDIHGHYLHSIENY